MTSSSHTPWSGLVGVGRIEVAPARNPVTATITLPGSKSVSNRALLLAALADGQSRLGGVLKADDTYWMKTCLETLGITLAEDAGTFVVTSPGWRRWRKDGRVYMGSAGTVGRFLLGTLACVPGSIEATASDQLSRRPISPLIDALVSLGADISYLGTKGCLPVRIGDAKDIGGHVAIAGDVSSQFISGLLMAAPLMPKGLSLDVTSRIVQEDYVRITTHYMGLFGATAKAAPDLSHFGVAPQEYRPATLALEADASTATYFCALPALLGGKVTISNLGTSTTQPDFGFCDVLERMGARVTRTASTVAVEGTGKLKGGFSQDMKPNSDATPTLAALAPFADGPIHIHGVAHIRKHESDRIAVMCRILSDAGIAVEEHPDGMTISPGKPRHIVVDPHDDHRIAMSASLIGLAGAGITITEPSCVSKTCPGYFGMLQSLDLPIGEA